MSQTIVGLEPGFVCGWWSHLTGEGRRSTTGEPKNPVGQVLEGSIGIGGRTGTLELSSVSAGSGLCGRPEVLLAWMSGS